MAKLDETDIAEHLDCNCYDQCRYGNRAAAAALALLYRELYMLPDDSPALRRAIDAFNEGVGYCDDDLDAQLHGRMTINDSIESYLDAFTEVYRAAAVLRREFAALHITSN